MKCRSSRTGVDNPEFVSLTVGNAPFTAVSHNYRRSMCTQKALTLLITRDGFERLRDALRQLPLTLSRVRLVDEADESVNDTILQHAP